jgi:hypothetical protein
MIPANKANRYWAFRLLLIFSHFVLLSAHFTGRYYTAANFFVYDSGNNVPVSNHVGAHGYALTIEHQGLRQQKAPHLSIDKRFRSQVFLQPSFSCSPPPPSYTVAGTTFFSSSFVYSSSGPAINVLRGPPCA